jgi:CheY-like chemotaxis protein/HPt (histidine-containing phosphotransfer) domain-containing protein
MAEDAERKRTFEARFLELKHKMEAGLLTRAHTLREAAAQLLSGDESARKRLKTESHKLRGIAGSYGYRELTELAAEVEQRASLSPPPQLGELASRLATAAEEVGQRSADAQAAAAVPTAPQRPPSAATPSTSRKRGASVRPAIAGGHGGPLRVLAMDDDPTTLRLLRLTLSDIGGFESTLVTAGREALEEMRKREFDVVISDAMMPDMNGREFCVAARKLGGYAERLPIIILSAATADELRWQGELGGPVAWLRKPFIPTSLVKDVARIVEQHRGTPGARSRG